MKSLRCPNRECPLAGVGTSFAMASTRLARESIVDICAGVAGRHSARTPALCRVPDYAG
jgi:hypothetical protein